MNKKTILIGLGVLAVAGIGYYMWKKKNETTSGACGCSAADGEDEEESSNATAGVGTPKIIVPTFPTAQAARDWFWWLREGALSGVDGDSSASGTVSPTKAQLDAWFKTPNGKRAYQNIPASKSTASAIWDWIKYQWNADRG